MSTSTAQRIVIVGGGVAGLSAAVRLAQAGLPVTLLEANQLGFEASTRNQGWLHSGAWFARDDAQLATLCYESLQQTQAFAPEVLEPGFGPMLYVFSRLDAPPQDWTNAWAAAGIPCQPLSRSEAERRLPGFDRNRLQHVYQLPDRAFRPESLLERLAAEARNAGVEVRTETPVTTLLRDPQQVVGVVTGKGENIHGVRVVLATGALDAGRLGAGAGGASSQSALARVGLTTHLVSFRPGVPCDPFCVVDDGGFNHIPHAGTSVFGSGRWLVAPSAREAAPRADEIDLIWKGVERCFPGVQRSACQGVHEWSGTTVQLMRADQVHPGRAPYPAVVDHGEESPADRNLWSISPGRATLWTQTAEELRRRLLDGLPRPPSRVAVAPWSTRTSS
jgi:glycine/D-amino acid oxidase-like deaminating enzyme